MNLALWIVQGLLAALFMFGGVAKLMMPIDEIATATGLPGPFILFIAIAEALGALGLILPWALRILPGLTPLAASGLVIIMIGATTLTAMGVGGGDPVGALFPGITGLLAAFVAYGRSRSAPRRHATRRRAVLATAA
jgi:predicted tellurium resistance membrane protein TerC